MTERASEQQASNQSNDPDVDADLRDLVELSSMSALIALPISCEQARLVVGQSVVLTIAAAGDGILTTEALIESVGDAPGAPLVLRVFEPLRRQQRRADVRLPMDVPARRTLRLNPGQDPQPVRARVLDMSAGGLLLQTPGELRPGERLVLAFTLPGDNKELRVSLVVRHSRSVEESAYRWESGCQFQVLRPADRERMAHYIFAQEREAARRGKALAAR